MKFKSYLLLLIFLIVLPSCGGDGKDKVGSLTLTVPETAALAGGKYSVSTMATYTNPNTTNLVGTEITFSISLPGYASQKKSLPTGGQEGVIFIVDQDPIALNFFIAASVGSLQSARVVSIPALGTIAAIPSALTFATTDVATSTKSVTIQNGTAPYSATSLNPALATASVIGSTVTITRISAGTGTVVVNVSDSAAPTASTISISVTLQ